jgi:DNA-binding GntR family transcriptional regulator
MSVIPIDRKSTARSQDARGISELATAHEFDILFGRLKPRERLVEDVLMRRFEAKRHVVRQALIDLERIGIVTREPNRGATVRDFSAQEVEEICELREILQRRAAQRIPLPAAPALVARLEAIQAQHDKAVAKQDPRAIHCANEEFHHTLFGACGSGHLAAAIEHYSYLTRAMRLYPLVDRELLEHLRKEHWEMIAALKAGDRRSLVALVVEHIQPSKRMYLEVRRGLGPVSLLRNERARRGEPVDRAE